MLSVLNELVESRIAEAQQRGDFNDLPGKGRPLVLDDDALVPEEMRPAYRMLKSAGFAPPEVVKLRDAASLRAALVAACDELSGSPRDGHNGGDSDAQQTRRLQRRLIALTVALDAHGVDLSTIAGGAYYRPAINKLTGQSQAV